MPDKVNFYKRLPTIYCFQLRRNSNKKFKAAVFFLSYFVVISSLNLIDLFRV